MNYNATIVMYNFDYTNTTNYTPNGGYYGSMYT